MRGTMGRDRAAIYRALPHYGDMIFWLPQAEAVPLLASLLSVPVPEQYPPLALSPQRQKQKT
jgi:hypothetical protein